VENILKLRVDAQKDIPKDFIEYLYDKKILV